MPFSFSLVLSSYRSFALLNPAPVTQPLTGPDLLVPQSLTPPSHVPLFWIPPRPLHTTHFRSLTSGTHFRFGGEQ